MKADMATPIQIVSEYREDAQSDTERANSEILSVVAALRRQLDLIEAAVAGGLRVATSVSGIPHVAKDADDLVRAITARQTAFDRVALLGSIARSIEARS